MSLKIKFAILLGLLGLAVLGSLGASYWSINILHSQLSAPVKSMATVLSGLDRFEGELDAEDAALIASHAAAADTADSVVIPLQLARIFRDFFRPLIYLTQPDYESLAEREAQRQVFESSVKRAGQALHDLESNTFYQARVGKSTSRNLRARVSDFQNLASEWFKAPEPTGGRATRRASKAVHDLIERIQSRVIAEQGKVVEFGDSIRSRLLVVLASSLSAAVLVGILALILVHRWVMSPVASLRTAAHRIGAGDFDHRTPVSGRDEIAQLSGEVNHMAGMVRNMLNERVERERLAAVGEMVRRLAHNLRNPLSGIRGLAELSRDETKAGTDVHEHQKRIILSVDRFEKWLADLLSATLPLSINPEPCQTKAFLGSILESHRPMAAAKNVRLELVDAQAPSPAWFDPRHMEHSLVAIVTNAIQASPLGGTVRITAAPTPTPGELEFRIADQGPGVPNALVDRIFVPYFTTKRDGNGIGLAIAQQVVKAHGGRITVEPGLGPPDEGDSGSPGATFVVRIPVSEPTEAGS
jgi:signal transduction histidine kinase